MVSIPSYLNGWGSKCTVENHRITRPLSSMNHQSHNGQHAHSKFPAQWNQFLAIRGSMWKRWFTPYVKKKISYGLDMYVPFPVYMLKSSSPLWWYMEMGLWANNEVMIESPNKGSSGCVRRDKREIILFSAFKDRARRGPSQTKRGPSPGIECASTLISNILASRTVRCRC